MSSETLATPVREARERRVLRLDRRRVAALGTVTGA